MNIENIQFPRVFKILALTVVMQGFVACTDHNPAASTAAIPAKALQALAGLGDPKFIGEEAAAIKSMMIYMQAEQVRGVTSITACRELSIVYLRWGYYDQASRFSAMAVEGGDLPAAEINMLSNYLLEHRQNDIGPSVRKLTSIQLGVMEILLNEKEMTVPIVQQLRDMLLSFDLNAPDALVALISHPDLAGGEEKVNSIAEETGVFFRFYSGVDCEALDHNSVEKIVAGLSGNPKIIDPVSPFYSISKVAKSLSLKYGRLGDMGAAELWHKRADTARNAAIKFGEVIPEPSK